MAGKYPYSDTWASTRTIRSVSLCDKMIPCSNHSMNFEISIRILDIRHWRKQGRRSPNLLSMIEERHSVITKNDLRERIARTIKLINRTSKLNENRDQRFLHVVLPERERKRDRRRYLNHGIRYRGAHSVTNFHLGRKDKRFQMISIPSQHLSGSS